MCRTSHWGFCRLKSRVGQQQKEPIKFKRNDFSYFPLTKETNAVAGPGPDQGRMQEGGMEGFEAQEE